MVLNEKGFEVVGKDFVKFLLEKITEYETDNKKQILDIVFVAHNGRVFDVPFLMKHLLQYNVDIQLFVNIWYLIDTLVLARKVVKDLKLTGPENYKLSSLYKYCTKTNMTDRAHRAESDETATVRIFQYRTFFARRRNSFLKSMMDKQLFH